MGSDYCKKKDDERVRTRNFAAMAYEGVSEIEKKWEAKEKKEKEDADKEFVLALWIFVIGFGLIMFGAAVALNAGYG